MVRMINAQDIYLGWNDSSGSSRLARPLFLQGIILLISARAKNCCLFVQIAGFSSCVGWSKGLYYVDLQYL